MKARALLAATLMLGMLAGMSAARSEVAYVSAGVAAGAGWSTAEGQEVFVGVSNGQPEQQQLPSDLYAYISIYSFRRVEGRPMRVPVEGSHPFWEPIGCRTQVKLDSTQFTFDPALERATLDIRETECGAVRVNWVQTGPLSPGFGVGAHPTWGYMGGGAALARPAVATGWVDKTRLTEESLQGAGMSIGAGAYTIFFNNSLMASFGAFRSIGAEFRNGSTVARVRAWQSLYGGASQEGVSQGFENGIACVSMRSTVRANGRMRYMGDGGCGLVSLELDPTLQTARIKGRLGSVTLDISFTGVGDLTPENQTAQELPAGPEDALEPFFVESSVFLSREATTSGQIVSRRMRTSMAATRPVDALLCEGLHAAVYRGHPYYVYLDD